MWEAIRHALGLCGEGHANLIWFFMMGGTWMLYYLKHNITWCWKQGCDMCRHKISKLFNKSDKDD